MIERGIDPLKTEVYEEASVLIAGLISEFRRLVKKTELGLKISRESPALIELERAYFHDLLELFFDRAVREFGNLTDKVKPVALKNQLRNDLVRNLKRPASMIIIESDLCSTILMDEYSELMGRFVADVERNASRPQVAA